MKQSDPRKKSRDLEKIYPRKDFVAKLRRLADALETLVFLSERLLRLIRKSPRKRR